MKILKLLINNKIFNFTRRYNLIYSSNNGAGKTTLVRAILYSLGFSIPATKGIGTFTNLTTKIILINCGKFYEIDRKNNAISLYIIKVNEPKRIVVRGNALKQEYNIQSVLFNTNNPHIIYNALGCFYFDQEKGWTLLNRGRVIGKYHFYINDYMASFIPKRLNILKDKMNKLSKENKFYRHLNDLIKDSSNMSSNDNNDISKTGLNSHINALNLYISKLKHQIHQLKQVNNSNINFIKLLTSLGLSVTNGKISIPINIHTVKNFDMNEEFIRIRLNNLYTQFRSADKKKIKLYNKFNTLFNTHNYASTIKNYVRNISSETIQKIITQNTRTRSNIKREINSILISSDKSTLLFDIIKRYAKELNVYKYIVLSNENIKESINPKQFIYTRQLKGYSGSVLHLLVFIFRLACLKMLEQYTHVFPIIILDSPQSGELSKSNVEKMFEFLNRHFSRNQIIVATIHKLNRYDFWNKYNRFNSIINLNMNELGL